MNGRFEAQLQNEGAQLAADRIPLHFGDQAAEYEAALNAAILLVRSHEGRIRAEGRDRLGLIQRISTNDVASLRPGSGAPTNFTNPNGRILDRATIYEQEDHALLIGEVGRGEGLFSYLQRNVFYNDDVRFIHITGDTVQFDLHGPRADDAVRLLDAALPDLPAFGNATIDVAGAVVLLARSKPLSGSHWVFVTQADHATSIWQAVLDAGAHVGLLPAGSLTYNALRIRAGRPAAGREINPDYIPLEVGLWDEVSFHKGCYTGQEIIARMESRNRLAKVMMRVRLDRDCAAPANVRLDGREIGVLTSSVTTPRGEHLGIAVVRTQHAQPDLRVTLGNETVGATLLDFAGAPPPMLETGN